MKEIPVVYVEIPSKNYDASKAFYQKVFGWGLADFGPTYSSTLTLGVNVGLQGDGGECTQAPLTVLEVTDLEAALREVIDAGGTVTRPIFSFPGGRRFQFRDPSGNELAVMQAE